METNVKYIFQATDPKPTSEKPILYNHLLCPYAERARIGLALKKHDHLQVDLDLSKKPEWYFTLNPNGTVPTYEAPDGRILFESDIIVETIDELYPDQGVKLLPDDKVERGIMKCQAKYLTGFINAYYAMRFGMNEERTEKLQKEIKKIEDVLADGRKYLSGDKFTFLDIFVFPHLERVLWFDGSVLQEAYTGSNIGEFKNVQAYYDRVVQIDDIKHVLCVPKAHQILLKKYKEEGHAKLVLPVQVE